MGNWTTRAGAGLMAVAAISLGVGVNAQADVPPNVGPAYGHFVQTAGGNVNICVNNRSDEPAETAVDQWVRANELAAVYEGGPGGCAGWPTNRIMRLYDGQGGLCTYQSFGTSGGYFTYMAVYFSNAPSQASCWTNSVGAHHWVSVGIGEGLGLLRFDTYPPTEVHVMRDSSELTVSYAQPDDWWTFDYHNGWHDWRVALLTCALFWFTMRMYKRRNRLI